MLYLLTWLAILTAPTQKLRLLKSETVRAYLNRQVDLNQTDAAEDEDFS